jgi:hypothetical protein
MHVCIVVSPVVTPNSIVAGPATTAAAACARSAPRWRTGDTQRAEHAEDQPVDVDQRQPVREHVVAPFPSLGEGVEVGGDRERGHQAERTDVTGQQERDRQGDGGASTHRGGKGGHDRADVADQQRRNQRASTSATALPT